MAADGYFRKNWSLAPRITTQLARPPQRPRLGTQKTPTPKPNANHNEFDKNPILRNSYPGRMHVRLRQAPNQSLQSGTLVCAGLNARVQV